jgi:hypothetical protein
MGWHRGELWDQLKDKNRLAVHGSNDVYQRDCEYGGVNVAVDGAVQGDGL